MKGQIRQVEWTKWVNSILDKDTNTLKSNMFIMIIVDAGNANKDLRCKKFEYQSV